ncbi:MAG: hypothetical protein COC05_05000 [Gammaproteobacteria bacterium]|nr:MAG: hypothetical protein COC05_05000 [Gammaproteobacteria bacterium]
MQNKKSALPRSTLVKEFMSSPVISVDINADLFEIINTLNQHTISCVLVVENNYPIGMITERSVVRCLAKHLPGSLDEIRAHTMMSAPIISIHENESLFDATILCRSQKIRHLPVLNEHQALAGIITYSDLVEANHLQFERRAALLGKAAESDSTESLNKHLLEMTLTDPLMEIGNRRAMSIDLEQTQQLAERYKRPFSIVLIDIDFFKLFNDHYGHLAGDKCLIEFANLLKQSIRNVDRLYRYGGEEILLLLPETESAKAIHLAKRIINSIHKKCYKHEKSNYNYLTASAGVSGYEPKQNSDAVHWQKLIEQADIALYQAKDQGRNCAKLFNNQKH